MCSKCMINFVLVSSIMYSERHMSCLCVLLVSYTRAPPAIRAMPNTNNKLCIHALFRNVVQ